MPNFREYSSKLSSLRNTRRVDMAMKMVSATKLSRAQQAQRRARDYSVRLQAIAARVTAGPDSLQHPLLLPRREVHNVLGIVFTSDRGLCGGFNNNLIRMVERLVREKRPVTRVLRASFCGRRGWLHFRNKVEVRSYYEGIAEHPGMAGAVRIARDVIQPFIERKYDEVYVAYNRFVNPVTQVPVVERLLPFEFPPPDPAAARHGADIYLFEPDAPALLDALLRKLVTGRLFHVLLETAAGEQGARMTAMDSAVKNIDKLLDEYTLLRNRARQAAITTELVEIISGAEALKS